jgi:hypothetical protein
MFSNGPLPVPPLGGEGDALPRVICCILTIVIINIING